MKKRILFLVLGVSTAMVLTSCRDKKPNIPTTTTKETENTTNHVHSYSDLMPALNPTCETAGHNAYYICDECEAVFTEAKVKVNPEDLVIAPLGHSYSELVLAVPAGCEADGHSAYYTCLTCGKYFNEAKEESSIDSFTIVKTGHQYGEVEYKLNDLKTQVIATRACENDSSHIETEAVSVTKEIVKEPTHTEKGLVKYTSEDFTNPAFTKQVIQLDLDILAEDEEFTDHSYTLVEKVDATCELDGHKAYYKCNTCSNYFDENKAATTVGDLVIPAIHHDYNEPTYEFNALNTQVTAKRVCKNDPTHIETETVEVTSTVTFAPDYKITYTSASFTNSAFEVQEKEENLVFVEMVITKYKKTYTLGESFSNEDVEVLVRYQNGIEEKVTDFTVDSSAVNKDKAGSYLIKVTYNGHTVEYVIKYNGSASLPWI